MNRRHSIGKQRRSAPRKDNDPQTWEILLQNGRKQLLCVTIEQHAERSVPSGSQSRERGQRGGPVISEFEVENPEGTSTAAGDCQPRLRYACRGQRDKGYAWHFVHAVSYLSRRCRLEVDPSTGKQLARIRT